MLERIVMIATPYSVSCASFPLTLAQWIGADLYILSRPENAELSRAILERAEEFQVRAFPSFVQTLDEDSIAKEIGEIKADLLVMSMALAGRIWEKLPDLECPVYFLNRTVSSHHETMALVMGEQERLPEKNKQLGLSVLVGGAYNGNVRLVHLLDKHSPIMGEPRKKQELLRTASEYLEQTLTELDSLVDAFESEGVSIDQNVISGDFKAKLAHLIELGKSHCIVMNRRVQKTLKLEWEDFKETLPCSLILMRNSSED